MVTAPQAGLQTAESGRHQSDLKCPLIPSHTRVFGCDEGGQGIEVSMMQPNERVSVHGLLVRQPREVSQWAQ